MPSTGEARRKPEQRPPPLSPFSGGRRTGRGRRPGHWFGVLPRTARRCARRRPERSRWLSLLLVLPPPRERLGLARSVTARAKMPSTGAAIRKPKPRPPPLSPFSRGRRTGRGDGGEAWALVRSPTEACWALRPSWTGAFASVLPPSCSLSSEGETRPCTFCRGRSRDVIDGRGDAQPREEPSAPESLLQREKDRKRGWGSARKGQASRATVRRSTRIETRAGANPDPDQAEAEGKHGIGWGRPGG
jgi:hypothetical protein